MGARLLAEWLAAPLTQLAPLNDRLEAVGELKELSGKSSKLRAGLRQVYDMQRLLARVATGRTSPRDLRHLANTLGQLPPLKELLQDCQAVRLQRLEGELDLCPETRDLLEGALENDCPLTYLEGGFIRVGYSSELDELRELTQGGKQWIARYQAEEAERCGIPNIKVGFNKVFGYYLEVTHAHTDKVPPHFIRKQTIKHAERYITPELKEHEEQVLAAEDRAKQLEADLFQALRQRVADDGRRLQATAEVLAELDVLSALAELAREREYCRPQLRDGTELRIVDGRHPVLDIVQPQGQFVPNDTLIAPNEAELLIITGPNMAGKSTYIRQVALITLMAQIGSFVPAAEAEIGLADAIFARVGASDELARGQSTFMVEMTETARILNTATARSLVILDEIGRGTSTYDGVSLAWAIVEHLHDVVGARTLFATHYHELTDLASSLSRVANWNVDVKEWDGEVVFLHRIVPGSADQSYGIHVARLAGVPTSVNRRAQEILAQLEDEHLDASGRSRLAPATSRGGELQLTLFDPPEHPLLQQLRELEVNRLTPLEALTQLEAWQRELARHAHGSKIGK